MIVQFFRYGNGLSKGPLDYLLGKDRDRDYAKVLQGDVSEVSGLIDTSPYAKKYTSGCLSFYEHDLSDQDKQKIMQDFEQALFPGMDQSQYRVLWIEHQDKLNEETGERRLELNFLIPNVEILTGKRLQPYYDKADRPRIDLFKKITNYEYQLHDADDPLYRQAVTTAKNLPKTVNEIKETLDIEATRAVESGLITDRQSMKKWLLDLGLEVTRETKKSLSIKNPNDDEKARPIRLTGAIYEQDFRLTETSQQLTIAASERYRREAEQRNQSDIQRYAEYSAKRSTELEQQYRQHQNGYTAETERSNERDIAADRPDYSSSQEAAATRHDSPIARTTTADQTATSELAAVERLEPRNSPSSQIKENPYYIEYSLDFTGMYNAYQQYLSGIRQQEQIQRYTSDAEQSRLSEKSGGEHDNNNVRRETVRRVRPEISRHELRTGQWNKTPSNSERDTLNELRSTIIEDYRRSTASVEATTASTRRSSTAYTSTVSDHQRIETIHANFKQHAQRSSEDSAEISEVRARTVRANYLSNFFTRCTTELESTVADTFKRFSAELADRQSSQKSGIEDYSASSRIGDQQSIETTSRTNHRENEFSRAVSAEISSINPTSVIKALDVLDQRKELQREQERQRSRDYDSPSPF
ncbi:MULTISPECIES: relaxase/mobilization nuclease domain-containing protein [unclassified Acinetobacter]|uniref:relaxase/mobilization nuclease domain-containing protein n=1 Tax=unclassified Acinetobacter TaxID=196816 RepID=UPI0011BEA1D0|nr:relaxase/mobilization nuclease domain-containing protein [Acinetobacter sp. SM1B]